MATPDFTNQINFDNPSHTLLIALTRHLAYPTRIGEKEIFWLISLCANADPPLVATAADVLATVAHEVDPEARYV